MKLGSIFLVLIGATTTLGSQSNKFLDEFLETDIARFEDTVVLTLAAANRIPADAAPADAMAALPRRMRGVRTEDTSRPATLGEFCYLVMEAFEIPGGLMYFLFPGPRYAARELAYLGMLSGSTNPRRTVSGEEVLKVLGGALNWREKRQ